MSMRNPDEFDDEMPALKIAKVEDTTDETREIAQATNATFSFSLQPSPNQLIFPVEVLGKILEEAYEDDRNIALVASSVCKQFRMAAEHQPRLWTVLTNKTSAIPSPSAKVLQLSRTSLLDVELEISKRNFETALVLLQSLKEAKTRLKTFRLSLVLPNENEDNEGQFSRLKTSCRGLEFPRLESISICYAPGDKEEAPENNSANDLSACIGTWIVPNVRQVSFRNIVPRAFEHGALSLTSVTVYLDEMNNTERVYDYNELAKFLGSVSSLDQLNLEFGYLGDCFEGIEAGDIEDVILPSLEEFSFIYTCGDPHDVAPFLRALHLPSLRRLDAKITVFTSDFEGEQMPAEAATEWINCILGGLPENNLLNELIFECLPKEDNDAILGLPVYTFRLPWDRLRDVQHLTLKTYDYYPAEIKHGDTLPTLQTLRLEGIPGLNNEWLVQLADNLQVHDEKWRALRKVWVAQCPGVDLGLLLDLYEGKEVYHDGILLGTEALPVELDVAAEVTEPFEADEAPQPALAEATQAAVEAAETTDPLEPVDIVNHLAAA